MTSSNKLKGILMILVAPISLIIILFLRVILGVVTVYFQENGEFAASEGVTLNIFAALLNFGALISVIGTLVLVPTGIIVMVKGKGDEPAIKGNLLLADRGVRLLAKFADGLLFFGSIFILSLITVGYYGENTDIWFNTLVFWLIVTIATFQAYYLTLYGQTIGKKWLKIQIVDAETHKVGGFVKNVLLRSVLNFVLSLLPFYGLVDALFIFREDRRCLHDLIAGTIVVRAQENDFTKGDVHLSKSTGKFCTHCGVKAKPSAKFCVSCGTSMH